MAKQKAKSKIVSELQPGDTFTLNGNKCTVLRNNAHGFAKRAPGDKGKQKMLHTIEYTSPGLKVREAAVCLPEDGEVEA